jgi:hypothetical protein
MQRQGATPNHIEYFERDFLDRIPLVLVDSLSVEGLGEKKLYRVDGLPRFWGPREEDSVKIQQIIEDLVSGIYESKVPLIYSVFGGEDGIEVSYGTFQSEINQLEKQASILRTSLNSSFHGIQIKDLQPKYLEEKLRAYVTSGLLTGVPSEIVTDGMIRISDMDRLLRGISRRDCGFIVVAKPMGNLRINNLYNMVLNEVRIILEVERHQGQESPVVRRYKTLLEKYLEKLQKGKSQGLWISSFFIVSDNIGTLNELKALAKSSFGGRDSIPDRIRTLQLEGIPHIGIITNPAPPSPGQFKWPYMYSTMLGSGDLASFVKLPSQEVPGFKIKPYVRFNVSQEKRDGIKVGEILDQEEELGKHYKMSLNGLKKHGLIVGGTGSGKTNTLFYILRELIDRDVPFLVLEPAKTEYRTLLNDEAFREKLQVFTLGDNNISPFRLNPFMVPEGVSIQTHLDLLKSVFNASFYMWGPLPHVLEQCLNEIYRDKGWDLTSNNNSRGFGVSAFPTLTDLYNKIDEVVNRIGYSPETTMELKSSLKTRLNSLRIGGKGLMLDTRSSIDFEKLLSKPTVLELETLGDDEEKSFMLGLVLTMMYEHYVSRGSSDDLKHVTIIEEAHRLLGNSVNTNAYTGDMKGKAVETFTNILSEIRAYGEGFLIADQIPTKLSTDVVKNTNLKVMHRIVAEDDRRIMAASMNIKEQDAPIVSTLYPLQAVAFSEGDDGAYHIKFPYVKPGNELGELEARIKMAMKDYLSDPVYLSPYGACSRYCENVCLYKDVGEDFLEDYRFVSGFSKLILSVLENTSEVANLLQMFTIGNDAARISGDPFGVKLCALIQGSERYFEELGRKYHWSYGEQESILNYFADMYLDSLKKYLERDETYLDQEKAFRFCQQYKELTLNKQPTIYCSQICDDRSCQYRYLLSDSLTDAYYHKQFANFVNKGGPDMWDNIISVASNAVQELNGDLDNERAKRLMKCFILQKSYQIDDFSQSHLDRIMSNVFLEIDDKIITEV